MSNTFTWASARKALLGLRPAAELERPAEGATVVQLAPSQPPRSDAIARVLHCLATIAALFDMPPVSAPGSGEAEARRGGATTLAVARRNLADALRPLRLSDVAALHAALGSQEAPLFAALAAAGPSDQARLAALGPLDRHSLARSEALLGVEAGDDCGPLLAIAALIALPVLPGVAASLALGGAQAVPLIAAEIRLAQASGDAVPAALTAVQQALTTWLQHGTPAALAAACTLPVARLLAAAEPWRLDLQALVALRPIDSAQPLPVLRNGSPLRFRGRLQIALPQPLAAGQPLRLSLNTQGADLPMADWTFLVDGQPVFTQRRRAEDGSHDILLQSATPLPAGAIITGQPPAGEFFQKYDGIAGSVWPVEPLPRHDAPPMALVITALAEPCFEGFHKPEHLPGAIGRWMSETGQILLPASGTPLRATIRGRHRLNLLQRGGLLASVGSTPLDLMLEPLGARDDAGEWLLHLNLPPTAPRGRSRLRLAMPDLPPADPGDERSIGLIFIAMEVTPQPAGRSADLARASFGRGV